MEIRLLEVEGRDLEEIELYHHIRQSNKVLSSKFLGYHLVIILRRRPFESRTRIVIWRNRLMIHDLSTLRLILAHSLLQPLSLLITNLLVIDVFRSLSFALRIGCFNAFHTDCHGLITILLRVLWFRQGTLDLFFCFSPVRGVGGDLVSLQSSVKLGVME